jgi:hypothetical protein
MWGSPNNKFMMSDKNMKEQKSATQVIQEAVAENKASHFKFEHEKNVPNQFKSLTRKQ